MSNRTIAQRKNLLNLACRILKDDKPLGVGLKNGCWAGVAIELAREKDSKMTDHYGLTMRQVKYRIKLNNSLHPELRNYVMVGCTLYYAFS